MVNPLHASLPRLIVIAALTALWLAGCASDTSEMAPVEERGAETAGAGGPGGADGSSLSVPRADLLAQRRVYFSFDSSTIEGEAREIVEAHAANLIANPQLRVHLEGHCDERGTREYNLALGERRAQAVERIMRLLGVPSSSVTTTTYGEERPLAPEHNESAWRLNRRVEIIYR